MFQEDDLATFDGAKREKGGCSKFQEYEDCRNSIQKRTHLSDGIKMMYLRWFLTGDALGSIICLYSSNANYEVEVTSVEWTREKFSDPIDRNVDAMTAETNLARLSFWQNKCCSLMKARSFRSGLEVSGRLEEDCSSEWIKGAWFPLVQKARCDGSSMVLAQGNVPVDTGLSSLSDECENSAIAKDKPF
ncbi:hypothetical protein T06_1599 [Trichinella sp. T6]|nr:hypothetical protein T06_1599 [Trichinella sp. T6]